MTEEKEAQEMPRPSPAADRRKWHWLSQGLLFLGTVVALAAAFFYLPVFQVHSVTVVGNSYVSSDDICRIASVAGIYRGQHLMKVNTADASHTLMKDLRIEQASVRRVFPNGIMIEVEERRPVAMVAFEFGFLDLDRQGIILNAHTGRETKGIPLLTGVSARERYIGDRVDQPQVEAVLRYLSYLRPEGLAQITEVALDDPGHVVARTHNASVIRVGALEPERLEEKAKVTQDFIEELRTTKHAIDYIDLTYAQPVIGLRQ